jgi:tetratricopeptide (TPR) repeat protein
LAVLFLALAGRGRVAGDEVVLRAADARRAPSRLTGEIIDFTSQRLVLRHAGGREETIEASRVADVHATWTKSHQAGNVHFDAAQFQEAIQAYRQAYAEEQRGWVRHRILGRSIWCLQYLDQMEQALDMFLVLHRQDPAPQEFAAIPLLWLTRAPAAGVERRCRELLDDAASPAGILIGASWLLTSLRGRSQDALRGLLNAADPRIAFLAQAQLWRTQVASIKPDEVTRWQEFVARMPPEIQAGPTYLLAQGLTRIGRTEESTLALMRLPILYPLHRDLVSHSLLEAGQQLGKMNDSEAAARLYREIDERFPNSSAAAEARRRLQESTPKNHGR